MISICTSQLESLCVHFTSSLFENPLPQYSPLSIFSGVVCIHYHSSYLTDFSLLDSFDDVNPFFHVFPTGCKQGDFSLWCDNLNKTPYCQLIFTNKAPCPESTNSLQNQTKYIASHFLSVRHKFPEPPSASLIAIQEIIIIIVITKTSVLIHVCQELW